MKRNVNSSQSGQSLLEYALLLLLVALVAIPLVVLFGGGVTNAFTDLFGGKPATTQVVLTEVPIEIATAIPTAISTLLPTPITSIAQDFMSRIMDYYNSQGKWPSSSSAKQFSDLGLKNSDWNQTVEGVYWDPNGSTINLTVKKEDNIQMYVNDLNGTKLKVYSNWPIVCVATSGSCYYHTVAPGNEVDINSVVVVTTK